MIGELIVVSLGLGVGLAMDACAVSMGNGLNEPKMKVPKVLLVAFMFAFFQGLMPLIGYFCVNFVLDKFEKFALAIPYVALALLSFIGGKMIFDGTKEQRENAKQRKKAQKELIAEPTEKEQVAATVADQDADCGEKCNHLSNDQQTATAATEQSGGNAAKKLTFGLLIVQAVATSIDALTAGFSIATYNWWQALIAVGIVAVVTFGFCVGGVFVGKKFGDKLGNKAEIFGGVVLICVGVGIFVKGMLEQFAII